MFAIRNGTGELTHNRNEILKVLEEFYGELYHSAVQPQAEKRTEITETPAAMIQNKKKAFKSMKRG